MARGKRYQPEQVVNLLRQIDVAVANGKTTSVSYVANRVVLHLISTNYWH
jgi:hypothetical protein